MTILIIIIAVVLFIVQRTRANAVIFQQDELLNIRMQRIQDLEKQLDHKDKAISILKQIVKEERKAQVLLKKIHEQEKDTIIKHLVKDK